jgi:hypothetical protein
MLNLSHGVIDVEREASKLEVPGPSFITQGVSLRRDGIYVHFCVFSQGGGLRKSRRFLPSILPSS